MRTPFLSFVTLLFLSLALAGCYGDGVSSMGLDPLHEGDPELQKQGRADLISFINQTSRLEVPSDLFPKMSEQYAALCEAEAKVTDKTGQGFPADQWASFAWHSAVDYHIWSQITQMPVGGRFGQLYFSARTGPCPETFQFLNYLVYAGRWQIDTTKPVGNLSFWDLGDTYSVTYSLPVAADVPTSITRSGRIYDTIGYSITYRSSDKRIIQITCSPWFFYRQSMAPVLTASHPDLGILQAEADKPYSQQIEGYTIIKNVDACRYMIEAKLSHDDAKRYYNIDSDDQNLLAKAASINQVALPVDSWDWAKAKNQANAFPALTPAGFVIDLFQYYDVGHFHMEGIRNTVQRGFNVTLPISQETFDIWTAKAADTTTDHKTTLWLYVLGTITRSQTFSNDMPLIYYRPEKLVMASIVTNYVDQVDVVGGTQETRETSPVVVAETDLTGVMAQALNDPAFSQAIYDQQHPPPVYHSARTTNSPFHFGP